MLHKIQHARSGGALHGARPGWLKYSLITDTLTLYLIQQYSSHYILIFIISDTRQELKDSELNGTNHPINLISVCVCVMKINPCA